ncbi:MAG: XRE family transcriptional regulator [Synergistaceae bacterium]|jgi:transcriptional regulator with XRE-family HTH domain|nr:XRE family transcriptional regulator [Synergistaceae bacterium]
MNEELGNKIKKLRKAQRLTLKELGEQVGLSISHLSLVERGLSSIDTVSLQAIAKCLKASLFYFLGDSAEENAREFIFRSYNQKPVIRNNLKVYMRIAHNFGEYIMDPVITLLLPGEKLDDINYVSHEGEEFHYVLEGVLTWLMEGARYELYPGDSVHIPSHIPHNWVNLTNNSVKVLSVVSPNYFDDESEDAGALRRTGK